MTIDGMNLHQHITIQVNVPRPQTEAERFWESSQAWARALEKMWAAKIAYEQKQGNPLFANIHTHEQYVAACEADEKRKRREQGFWKYHFGS